MGILGGIGAIAGGALLGALGGKGGGGNDPIVIPPVLDIDDAAERVRTETQAGKTPYSPFLPFMFGTGGAGRFFGVPNYTPEWYSQMIQLSRGPGTGPTLSGILSGTPGKMMPNLARPLVSPSPIPIAGMPQTGMRPYVNPFANFMNPNIAGQLPVPMSMQDEDAMNSGVRNWILSQR